jgi:hypothetical protein
MEDARGFDLWWEEQAPRLTSAYLPFFAARLGDGKPANGPALRFWATRVLPLLRVAIAGKVDEFERRVGRPVGVAGIDVVTGTVETSTHDRGGMG